MTTFSITPCEKKFIQYCREYGYLEIKLTIHNGEPTMAREVERSIRFDLSDD